jgi:hypothetical protein
VSFIYRNSIGRLRVPELRLGDKPIDPLTNRAMQLDPELILEKMGNVELPPDPLSPGRSLSLMSL